MSDFNLSAIWSEWQIERQLGRGSFGTVYKAVRRDSNVESFSAIKVISIPADDSEIDTLRSEGLDEGGTRTYFKGIVDDFVSEIQLMESMKGIQNIVSVEDYRVVEREGTVGWDIYIRMELLTPFNTHVCDKTLDESEVIKLGIDICTALEICGKINIIHRDIKPENIFVNDFGYYKLGDFGIARKLENTTGGLSQKGTFNYMAPEVANSTSYDSRADIYSLGLVLYKLLNGNRLPFLDTDKQLLSPTERKGAVDRRLRGEAIPAPKGASAAMALVILRACAFDKRDRFASPTEMKEALIGISRGTYKSSTDSLGKTATHLKKEPDLDATSAVRRAPTAPETPQPKRSEATPTFGTKRRSRTPKIIAIILVIALLVGGAAVAYPIVKDMLADSSEGGNENGGDNGGEGMTDEEKIDALISDADKLAASGYLDQAIAKLEGALATYPSSEKLKSKLAEYNAMKYGANKQALLSEAEALAAGGDYLGAMLKMKAAHAAMPDDVDIEIAYYGYCEAYETAVITKAQMLADAGMYNEAVSTVDSGLEALPESERLISAKARFLSLIPTAFLYELQYTNYFNGGNSDNKMYMISGGAVSFIGTPYPKGLLLTRGGTHTAESPYVEYDLGDMYSFLTGNISMIAGYSMLGEEITVESYDLVRVIFYLDGTPVLTTPWTNPTIDIGFEIDLSGAETLRIEIEGESEYVENCIALTGLALYGKDSSPVIEHKTASHLYELGHVKYSQGGNEDNALYRIRGTATSFLGESFTEGLLLLRGGTYTAEAPFVEYKLGGRYSLLTGKTSMITAISMLGREFNIRTSDLARIVFIADGRVVYSTPLLNPTQDISFSVDLSGVDSLKIAIETEDYYAKCCIGLVGLELYTSGNEPESEERTADTLPLLEYSEYGVGGNLENAIYRIVGSARSFLGEVFEDGLIFLRNRSYTESAPYLEYKLGGKYTRLTGKVSMIAEAETVGKHIERDSDDLARVLFYVNGKLVHTTPVTNPTMDITFDINLEGADTLRIEVETDNKYADNCIALVGLELSK